MMTFIYKYCFWILNMAKMGYHQFIGYSIAQSTIMYPLLYQNLNLQSSNWPRNPEELSTSKPVDTVRIRVDKEKTWNKKGPVIALNDHPCLYNVLYGKGNLTIRNRCHLIATNKKFIVKHDYDIIIAHSQLTSWKTVV